MKPINFQYEIELNKYQKDCIKRLDNYIRYKNRTAILCLANAFKNMGIECMVYSFYSNIPNLPSNESIDYNESDYMGLIDSICDKLSTKDGRNVTVKDVRRVTRDAIHSCGFLPAIFIVGYYKSAKVTNERRESVTVEDLYFMVSMKDGVFNCMYAMVAKYSADKAISKYAFSHIPRVAFDNMSFMKCCLGSGPLSFFAQNMFSAKHDYGSIPAAMYSSLAYNIDNYFHVESILGGPYIRMSEIKPSKYSLSSISDRVEGLIGSYGFYTSSTFSDILLDIYGRMKTEGLLFIESKFINFGKEEIGKTDDGNLIGINTYNTHSEDRFCIEFTRIFTDMYPVYKMIHKKALPSVTELSGIEFFKKYVYNNGQLMSLNKIKNFESEFKSLSEYNDQYLFDFNGRPVRVNIYNINSLEDSKPIMRTYVNYGLCCIVHKMFMHIYLSNNGNIL